MTAQIIDLNQRRIAVRLSNIRRTSRKGNERTGNRFQRTYRPNHNDGDSPNNDGPSAA